MGVCTGPTILVSAVSTRKIHKKVTIGQKRHGNGKKDHANSFVQFMEYFSKLKKAVGCFLVDFSPVPWDLLGSL
jgi:hypothetical protein